MQTDVLIIGSGVAAAALALKILNNRPAASVLMLEAGDRVKLRDFALFQNYLITGKLPYSSRTDLDYPERDVTGENSTTDKDVILKGGRSMVYGGSTIHWGGWSFRMKPEDFKTRTLTGKGIDWAFDYEELEPFYGEAEHYIGVSGDSTDQITPRSRDYPYRAFPFTLEDILHIKSFEKLGYSYSHLPIARHGFTNTISSHAPCQTTGTCKYCPFGARYAASNYLDDLARDGDFPNFAVRLNMVAEEIIMSSKSQAGAVKVINKTGNAETVETIEAETIIIASGAIESPKLLQRSTSEFWAQGIGNDRDLVGRNFVTHPYFFYKAELKENSKQFQPEMGFPTLVSRHFDSPEEQAQGKFILINPPGSPFQNSSDVMKTDLSGYMKAGKSTAEIKNLLAGNLKVQIQGIIEVFSELHNRVGNFDKRNRFGMIETTVEFKKDPNFEARMSYVKSVADRIFEHMGAANSSQENAASWRVDHAACTTRMSDSPESGVVDKNLKVFGVDNLYVCSNGSFPNLGAVNPTLTLTALALRLGDHLAGKNSNSDRKK